MKSIYLIKLLTYTIFLCQFYVVNGGFGVTSSLLLKPPGKAPELILISGCTGTGKSTFGMEAAITRGILKCISTDTIRQILRTQNSDRALHRSSFQGTGDPVTDWKATCRVLNLGIESIIEDSIRRGTSLVLEGVHLVPGNKYIDKWVASGGAAAGVVLSIPDADTHRKVIFRRGEMTSKGATNQIDNFPRIRAIHDEMVRIGQENQWLVIEQKPNIEPRPMDLLNQKINAVWVEGASRRMLSIENNNNLFKTF